MFSLESDEMTALWPNDSLTFTFYVTFSNSIPYWTTFVKEVSDSIFVHVRMLSNTFKRVQTRSNAFKRVHTRSNMFKRV